MEFLEYHYCPGDSYGSVCCYYLVKILGHSYKRNICPFFFKVEVSNRRKTPKSTKNAIFTIIVPLRNEV